MHRCHVRFSGVGSVEALLRLIHAREDALLPSLVPDGYCEALDVCRFGSMHRVRARIRTRGGTEMWVQVEERDVFSAVRTCFDVARGRLERRSTRPGIARARDRREAVTIARP